VAEIYQHDANSPGDEAYETGDYRHLLPGNRGRMLDPRRTPVRVLSVDEARGMFEVEVEAFEDRGARWNLPVEDVSGFQFEAQGGALPDSAVDRLATVAERLDRLMTVEAHANARGRTLREIEEQRRRVRADLAADPQLAEIDVEDRIASRHGSPAAAAALSRLLERSGLAELDRSFSQSYVSNPRSGETVKGHAIVIAEMGLCPYVGKVVRDEQLFSGDGARERRRAHVLLRLAFNQELFSMLGLPSVVLYRGAAIGGRAAPPAPSSLVAATFSKEVATALFESMPAAGLLARQAVPASRLLMTFLETPAMDDRYREAEAVLIGEPDNLAF
jgi:hypothetical protein